MRIGKRKNQRLDRIVEYLRQLEKAVRRLDSRLAYFKNNIKESECLAIMEEGMLQAASSVTEERTSRLSAFDCPLSNW